MSKPANKTLIGIFVVGAIALAVAAVLILGSGKFFRQTTLRAVCYFEGSVGGLNIGAPVVLRGVKIGSVTDVVLRLETTKLIFTIPVYIEIEPDKIAVVGPVPKKAGENFKAFIDRGLRASLEMQSIVTGQMQVGLDFHPDKPAKFTEFRIDTETQEIPTIPTPMQEFAKKIKDLPIDKIAKDMASATDAINKLVNSPEIMQTVRSISQAADETRQLVHNVNVKVGPVLSNVEGAVGDARQLIQNVDGKIGPVATNVNDTAKEIQALARSANEQVQPLSASAQETLKEAQTLLRGLDEKTATLTSRIDEALKDAQHLIRNADGEIGPVAISLRSTLASIEKAAGEAEVTLREAQQALKAVGGDLGEDSELIHELKQALRDVRGLAKAIRDLADTLERQPESAIFGKKNQTGR
jgi:paraquat-inducible protein B